MKILNLVPIISDLWSDEMSGYSTKYLLSDTQIVTRKLIHGTASIECEYDEVFAAPEIVLMCMEAEKEGFDAIFINCFGDPGVRAARECVNIPVFGGFEPAMFYALGIGDKVGIVTVLPEVVPMLQGIIAKEGLGERVPSLRYVNIPVLSLEDLNELTAALVAESIKAIENDGASVIVLGCTGMIGVKEAVEEGLRNAGYDTKVVEAAQAALILLETHVRMGWKHSRVTYMPPREKARNWWGGDAIVNI